MLNLLLTQAETSSRQRYRKRGLLGSFSGVIWQCRFPFTARGKPWYRPGFCQHGRSRALHLVKLNSQIPTNNGDR